MGYGLEWKMQHRGFLLVLVEQTPLLEEAQFLVCSKMLQIYHRSVSASAIFFAAVIWGSSSGATEKLIKLIRKAGSALRRMLHTTTHYTYHH